MTSGDKITLSGVILGIIAIIVAVTTPETRCVLHLDECPLHKPFEFSSGNLTETGGGGFWDGPITRIYPSGINQWKAWWSNNKGEQRNLIISVTPKSHQAQIFEVEPNQTWNGTYIEDTNKIEIKGSEAGGKFDFGAILYKK